METLRNEVIKALEGKLGEKYQIIPRDKRKNNGIIRHGICIHKENERVSPLVYLDEYGFSAMGEMNPDDIADVLLRAYRQKKIPQNIATDLWDFGWAQKRIRVRVVNYDANLETLDKSPHRKFLDLAITYYLEMAIAGQGASIAITNELMESWGVTEDDLYRIGMEKLFAEDACCITEMFRLLRQLAQEEQDEMTEAVMAEFEEDRNLPKMYVAFNQKHSFGANCLLNVSLLQEFAESRGCSLIIYPSSIHEIILLPANDKNENCLDTRSIQEINHFSVLKNEWLSNSIYRYDREKKEVSVYKEGAPLLW